MQLFSVDAIVFSKNMKRPPSKVAHNRLKPFFHSPTQPTAHSPELIFHIINMSQETSVSLSVDLYKIYKVYTEHLDISKQSFEGLMY